MEEMSLGLTSWTLCFWEKERDGIIRGTALMGTKQKSEETDTE